MRAMFALAFAAASGVALAASPAVVVHEADVMREEPPPHGSIGMSTVFRISDAAPRRSMEFRKRILHVGAAIGVHPITHDEVYYVASGEGDLTAGGQTVRMRPGDAAYLYEGDAVGIEQRGEAPLVLIISYPLPARTP